MIGADPLGNICSAIRKLPKSYCGHTAVKIVNTSIKKLQNTNFAACFEGIFILQIQCFVMLKTLKFCHAILFCSFSSKFLTGYSAASTGILFFISFFLFFSSFGFHCFKPRALFSQLKHLIVDLTNVNILIALQVPEKNLHTV